MQDNKLTNDTSRTEFDSTVTMPDTTAPSIGRPSTQAKKPNSWQRVAFWSVFPAVLIAPAWFAFGRGFLGAGGWMVFITVSYAFIVILPYQIAVAVLALTGKKGYLSQLASWLVFAYYMLLIITQVSLVDGGDTTESVGSVLTFLGLPQALNDMIMLVSLTVGMCVMVALIVVLARDSIRNRHTKLVNPQI